MVLTLSKEIQQLERWVYDEYIPNFTSYVLLNTYKIGKFSDVFKSETREDMESVQLWLGKDSKSNNIKEDWKDLIIPHTSIFHKN